MKISTTWWKDLPGNLFHTVYIAGDDSREGYVLGQEESLEERTRREVNGIETLLRLQQNAKILDLPCGYGRHSLLLAKKGYDVTGMDYSKTHLSKAVESSQGLGLPVSFVRGDMRKLAQPHQGKYQALINMFYSFGFFSEEENLKTMQQFYKALASGGKLLLHTDVSPEMIRNRTTKTNEVRSLKDGGLLYIREQYDHVSRRMTGYWEVTDTLGKQRMGPSYYSVRIYDCQEFTALAKEVGFKDVKFYGNFDATPFKEDSKEMIMVAVK